MMWNIYIDKIHHFYIYNNIKEKFCYGAYYFKEIYLKQQEMLFLPILSIMICKCVSDVGDRRNCINK